MPALRSVRPPRPARGPAIALAVLLLGPSLAASQGIAPPATPPIAEQRPHLVVVHGDTIEDPYFWLRNKADPAVRAYLESENAYAESMLAPTKGLQERLYREMLSRIKQTDLSVPYREDGYWYYTRVEEGKQYPIYLRRRGSMEAPEQLLLDLNEMAKGQSFMSLGDFEVSDDGSLLAYSFDSTGFRQYALRVKDLRTGRVLPDRAGKVGSLAWAADGRTLFYTVEDEAKRQHRLYRHVLGQTGADELLHEEPDKRFGVRVGRTRSGDWLVLRIGSLTTSEVRVLPADRPAGTFAPVAARIQGQEYSLEHHGDRFFIRANDAGRNFRLVSAPVATPGREHWKEVVPHRADVMLEDAEFFRDFYVLSERAGGLQRLRVVSLATGTTRDVPFPEPTYAAGTAFNPEFDTPSFRYSYRSFVTPSSVYEYDVATAKSTLLKQTEVLGGYDPKQYVSERVHVAARDGTRIPVSLVYRRGVARDGSAPLLLAAYGSYGSPSSVGFSSNRLSLLDRGFVFALAHIRGGGDLGQAWHDDGRMMKKMNTFTDYVDVAQWLVDQRYTSSSRLVAEGASAGGLLMGAVANLRPDLFGAMVIHVPFVDVVNTMLDETIPLTVGEFEEWGNPKIEAEYRYLRQYDPYLNIARKAYPAMLVKTSFNDSQVLYHEPAKYTARMRAMRTDDEPLLLVTNMGAGHGGSSGRYDRLREIALDYAFMLQQVGLAEATP